MKKIITLIIAMLLITTATYAYNLTKEIAGRQMTSTINSGTVVSLIYNDIAGYTFTGWSSTDIAITNASSKSISFTMPAKNVKIVANVTSATSAIIANKDIAIGKYIKYTPSSTSYKVYESDSGYGTDDSNTNEYQEFNPSQTTLWRVMYNNNGQLDIISAKSIGDLCLKGVDGYTKAVNTLSNLSKAYINSTYATGARALGETSSSVGTINTTTYPLNYGVSGAPYEDETYINDVNQLKNNSISIGSIWLASRYVASYSSELFFDLRCWGCGSMIGGSLYYVSSDGSTLSYSNHIGVCPVVSLDSGILIVSGSGTSGDPYIITK